MNSILTKEEIRSIFLANGFTIKPGNDDLKDYVYAAAQALEEAVLLKMNATQDIVKVPGTQFKIVLTQTPEGIHWDTQFRGEVDEDVYQLLCKESDALTHLYQGHIVDGHIKHAMNNHLWCFIRANNLNCVDIEWK